MNVLVDTTVWSLAFRRRRKTLNPRERALCFELEDLVKRGQAIIIGPIRQELLTGIREEAQFERLRDHLRAFEDHPLDVGEYEDAARVANQCLGQGIAGSDIDLLICAVSLRRGLSIFTTDPDFDRYGRILPIRLHSIPTLSE